MHQPTQSRQNKLLDLMDPADLHGLKPHLTHVILVYKLALYEAHR